MRTGGYLHRVGVKWYTDSIQPESTMLSGSSRLQVKRCCHDLQFIDIE